jgi:tetratricopeptide (TPR) repeat protein
VASAPRLPSDPPPDDDTVADDPLVPPRDPFPTVPDFVLDAQPGGDRVPDGPPTMPPIPAAEPILAEAFEMRRSGDWDGALVAYEKILAVDEAAEAAAQASVFASMGEVQRAQGRPSEARTSFERALAVSPDHVRSHEGLVGIAMDQKDWAEAAELRRTRVAALRDPTERASELRSMADLLEHHLVDLQGAADALERANLCSRGDLGLLSRLKDIYEKMEEWPGFHATVDALCRLQGSGATRGAYRYLQADRALHRERNEARALAFLELALDEDPQHDLALSTLSTLRSSREEWAALAQVHERLLERLAGLDDRARAWEVVKRLAVLRRDRLADARGAHEAFRGAVELRPDDLESRAALADLLAAFDGGDAAAAELEALAARAPLRVETYQRLYDLHAAAGRADAAWLAATCLEDLGVTGAAHDAAIDRFRTYAPIRPKKAAEPAWWDTLLRAPGADPIVCDILRIVGDAAIQVRLEAKKRSPEPDPSKKQDERTTASVVRTFHWASRTLGIETPNLYVMDAVPSGIAAMQTKAPSTALGPQVTAGMTVQQLAFLVGRHLTYYRPEHYALVFFPTLAELSTLVRAAMRLIIPAIEPQKKAALDDALAARLGPQALAKLERTIAELDARGGTVDLLAWIRHVELTAARAGLVLAGDLRVAMRLLKSESRAIGELSLDAKRGDLLAFTASRAARELRERMGVAAAAG